MFTDERIEHFGDHARFDQGQIALHVDDDLARQVVGDLGHAIGAGAMPRLRVPDHAAEPFDGCRDPVIVGGDDNRIDAARVGGATIDVLDHGTAGDIGERLPRESR